MDQKEWEAICDKCGRCCYEKVDLGCGEILYTDEPCVHLDKETKLCKVYNNRHEVEPDCISLTPELVRTLNWLPPGCAYVERIRFRDTLEAVRTAANQQKGQKKSNRRR
jgi:uncharacterized protein